MRNTLRIYVCLTGVFASGAFAKDSVLASVSTPYSGLTPALTMNGSPYTSGNYVVGTIHLFYEVNAMQFTAGSIASFQLNLADVPVNSIIQPPTYPVGLNLGQVGSTSLTLTPATSSYSVGGLGWSASTVVTVSVANSVPGNPALNVDGTELIAAIKPSTTPAVSYLGTPTVITVHVRLVHPTACLRVYEFLMDQAMTQNVTSLPITLKSGKTKSTTPPQLSNNVLVVNTCSSPQTFDLSVNVDPDFDGVGGNPVNTYFKSGATDPSTFDLASFGTGTSHGTSHCLSNITLPGGNTLLTTVHIGIGSYLPSELPASGMFSFSASAGNAGSGCPGNMNALATPNPAGLSVPFTIQ